MSQEELENAYNLTRDDWRAYQERSTPWPKSRHARLVLIKERLRITKKRRDLCTGHNYKLFKKLAELDEKLLTNLKE